MKKMEPKMVLDLVFDNFSCISMVCIIQNPKIPGGYPISGNIRQKLANFCKRVPRTKTAISDISRFWIEVKNKMTLKPENWPSYSTKWSKKFLGFRFLNFHFCSQKWSSKLKNGQKDNSNFQKRKIISFKK